MSRISKATEAVALVVASLDPVLAPALKEIAKFGEKAEASATALLTAIRKNDIRTLDQFDAHILAAYQANRWHTRPGRPSKDRRSVPHTVRTYVWEIRSAYRAEVDVMACKTMYDLRMRRKEAREAASVEITTPAEGGEVTLEAHVAPEAVAQDLLGVKCLDAKRFNGALFHDLIVTFVHLPDGPRALYGRQLARLQRQYMAHVKLPEETPAKAPKQAAAGK